MVRVDAGNAGNHDVSVLLQKGVYVERTGASSVLDFICSLLNLEPETVLTEVKTIMTDNKVVDDPASEQMNNAGTLVLSGAMPGLVGAMLRSDSPYKAMRSSITSAGKGTADSPMIKIKFFNTVLRKFSKAMLEHGFWIDEDGS